MSVMLTLIAVPAAVAYIWATIWYANHRAKVAKLRRKTAPPCTALVRVFDPQRDWEEYAGSIEYAQFTYEASERRGYGEVE